MTILRHPLSGATYRLREDGLVDVDSHGLTGTFDATGRHHGGELRQADPHLLLWIAGPRLARTRDARGNR